jgi:signal transduction histidine kinase
MPPAESCPSRPDEVASSEARRQIQELTAALEARDRFLALVGHELRNSVSPMLLLAEQFAALVDDPQAPPLVVTRAEMLSRHLARFVTTVDRVAEVADLRRGRLRLEPTTMDLVDVVEQVCREMRREADAGGAELVIDAAGPVTGWWDRSRIKQIVSSLVSNAIRYGGGGRVELSVRVRGEHAELAISDQGPGIEPAMLAQLFDRLDHDRPGRAGGIGIGLWMVKTLCSAMRGSVTAVNGSSGGARFCVTLPRG